MLISGFYIYLITIESQYHCLELLSEKNNITFNNQFFKEFAVHCDIASNTDA